MSAESSRLSASAVWVLIGLLLLMIIGKGVFTYLVVGDRGQPGWDYRPVPDVPGESPYAIYAPMPYSQHIRGAGGE